MQCPSCDADAPAESTYCPSCGERLQEENAPPANAKEKLEATIRENAESGAKAAGDHDPEEDLWQGRYSSKAMYGRWILGAVVTVALIIAAVGIGLPGWGWKYLFVPVLVLAWGYIFGLFLFRRMNAHYELTNQRLIHRAGIFHRTTDRIEVIDMIDVLFEQSLLERPFGVGSIRITSKDTSHPYLKVIGIDNVHEVADLMDKARRKERLRRGIHIESV